MGAAGVPGAGEKAPHMQIPRSQQPRNKDSGTTRRRVSGVSGCEEARYIDATPLLEDQEAVESPDWQNDAHGNRASVSCSEF